VSGAASSAGSLSPAERRKGGRLTEITLPAAGVAVGILLILGPFLATVIRSVLYWEPDGVNLSLKNFAGLLSDPRFYQAAGNTVLCGAGATLMSCLLGFSLAWIVSRTNLPGRRWFEIINLVPFFL
jgi:iron(III) transport system permease protein